MPHCLIFQVEDLIIWRIFKRGRNDATEAAPLPKWKKLLDAASKKAPFTDKASLDLLIALDPKIPPEGQAEYLFLLGAACDNEKGRCFNRANAREYYEKAVELGSAWAANSLGWHWAKGTYERIDTEKAITLLTLAHKAGHPQRRLGCLNCWSKMRASPTIKHSRTKP